ncbi:hypothetical protein PMI41_04301 [Phyllobacterium sp. YR531]|nr:hypothetical protein PMI41_04301 [Phyllobacterium sp. YR531]
MALLDRDRRIFATSDWEVMQRAHNKASLMLDRCPKTHPRCNALARTVMALFDSGVHNADELAALAANRELGHLAIQGYFHKPFAFKPSLPKNDSTIRH